MHAYIHTKTRSTCILYIVYLISNLNEIRENTLNFFPKLVLLLYPPAQNVPIFLFWPDAVQTLLLLHWVVYHFCSSWQIGVSFCPGYADRKCSIHAEAVEQSPQKHLSACLSPPSALQRLGQIIIMGYENFTWNSAFFRNKSGVCDSTAGPFY